MKAKSNAKWRGANAEKVAEKSKEWALTHAEQKKETDRRWQLANPEEAKEKSNRWKRKNRERCRVQTKCWAKEHPERVSASYRKHTAKRRLLGFIALNGSFPGCEGHHVDNEQVIYMPKELHRSVYHRQSDGRGMEQINAVAYNFLFKQEVEIAMASAIKESVHE
jgi:hypothetical protein